MAFFEDIARTTGIFLSLIHRSPIHSRLLGNWYVGDIVVDTIVSVVRTRYSNMPGRI